MQFMSIFYLIYTKNLESQAQANHVDLDKMLQNATVNKMEL